MAIDAQVRHCCRYVTSSPGMSAHRVDVAVIDLNGSRDMKCTKPAMQGSVLEQTVLWIRLSGGLDLPSA
jgi:hypothetical protein